MVVIWTCQLMLIGDGVKFLTSGVCHGRHGSINNASLTQTNSSNATTPIVCGEFAHGEADQAQSMWWIIAGLTLMAKGFILGIVWAWKRRIFRATNGRDGWGGTLGFYFGVYLWLVRNV